MDLSLSNITFNQILVFIAVAETGGFLKASSQLHLSQSAVSKSIAKLEKDLQLQLFQRSTRKLELTKEGEQLFEAWKPMVISMQTAYRHVLQNKNESQVINIGLVSTVLPEKYFPPVQKAFQKDYPEVRMQLYIESMQILEEMLQNGSLDVAFLPDFEHYSLDDNGLSWFWFHKKTARLIMSTKHPLSGRTSVQMNEILDETFVTLKDQMQDNYEKDLKDRFADYGAVPKLMLPYHSAYAIRNLFRPQDEVLFVDQFFDTIDYEDTVKIPVADEWNGIICAYRDSKEPCLRHFLELVRKHAVIED